MSGRQEEEEEGRKTHGEVWRLERTTQLGHGPGGGDCVGTVLREAAGGEQEAGLRPLCESSRECEL